MSNRRPERPPHRGEEGYIRFVSAAAVAVFIAGAMVVVAWLADIPVLKSVLPGLATMKFNTALCFVLSGMALWFSRERTTDTLARRWSKGASLAVVLIALPTLAEYLLDWNLGLDEWLVRDYGTDPNLAPPGRMSAATAQCFLCLGLSLLLLDKEFKRGFRPAEYLALLTLFASLIGALGYLFGIQGLYEFIPYSSMALHTSILIILTGVAILTARPRCGIMSVITSKRVGGVLARRILPLALALCVFMGWLRLMGEKLGSYSTEVGTAILVVAGIVMFAVATWFGARSLNRLHEELEERNVINERFAAIIDSSVDAIIGKDLNSIITSWNKGAETVFGYSAEAMVGQSIKRVIPPDRQAEEDAIISRMKRGERVEHFETVRQRKDGRLIHVSVSISPIKDGSGNVVGASKVARDITDRIRAEESIRIQAEDLARSNKDLEQFAYVASHDLQEPLRAVAGCLQVLQRRYADQLDARADELIGHAVDGSHRMRTLIEGLLAFSRVGTRGGEFQSINCDEAVDAALKNLATAIAESGAVVTRDPLPAVHADPVQLSLLLQNLIGNAIKFRGEEPPRIHVGARHEEGRWLISVKDNGIGIEPQFFDRIFTIFQRLHTRREYTGTGLGLAICKRIGERHGGQIKVESAPGKGSTFICCLPDSR